MVKRIPISLIMVVLIISLSIIVRWVRERGPEANGTHIVASNRADVFRGAPEHKIPKKEQQINDCDAWAGMSFKEKNRNYRLDPERWARCLCAGEGCELDRLYLTGRVSR